MPRPHTGLEIFAKVKAYKILCHFWPPCGSKGLPTYVWRKDYKVELVCVCCRGMQQLMTLWTEFQQAEKLHGNRIRDMEERLQRVGS